MGNLPIGVQGSYFLLTFSIGYSMIYIFLVLIIVFREIQIYEIIKQNLLSMKG